MVMKIPYRGGDNGSLRAWPHIGARVCSVVLMGWLFVGCSGSTPVGGESVEERETTLVALPVVDLSERPVADNSDPALGAGAAADFVDCEHGIWQGGGAMDFGPRGSGPDPDAALEDMIEQGTLGIPDDGFMAVGRDDDRILYVYEVGGIPKASLVIVDSSKVDIDSEDLWAIEAFASCDLAEFDPSTDGSSPRDVWENADGVRVPTSVISSARGPQHCGWESATFLRFDGKSYVSDPAGVLSDAGLVVPFDDDAELPSDSIDTGYQREGRRVWLSSDRTVAFIVTGDSVEAWPSATDEIVCF